MEKKKPVEEVLEKAKIGEIMFLYMPTWVQTCLCHHGTDHLVGFYRGTVNDRILISASPRDCSGLHVSKEEVDGARILTPDTEVKPVNYFCNPEFDKETIPGDCLLLHTSEGRKVVGFYCGHGAAPDRTMCAVDLAISRKQPYQPELEMNNTSNQLLGISGFQNIDRFMLDPDNDGIDHILIDILYSYPALFDRCKEGEYKQFWRESIEHEQRRLN